jgi:hypothetical protein
MTLGWDDLEFGNWQSKAGELRTEAGYCEWAPPGCRGKEPYEPCSVSAAAFSEKLDSLELVRVAVLSSSSALLSVDSRK